MLLFKLADLPRSVRRLARPLPLGLERSSAPYQIVSWTLRPALLDPADARTRGVVERLLALYAEAVGQSRAALDTLAIQVEDAAGDYRLGRCLARTIEARGYHFAPPATALGQDAATLRTLCYRRAQEAHDGVIPAADRARFLAGLAADLGVTPAELEAALWADRAGAALLTAGPARGAASADTVDAAVALTPERISAAYNAGAVATLLAAASWVTLRVAATQTTALKELYRHARAAHVGVEIAVSGRDPDLLHVTLYGPGSRALVRGRTIARAGAGPPPAAGDRPDVRPAVDAAAEAPDAAPAPLSIPAPGGASVAAVIARLVRRHPTAVQGGWARVLGANQRLFHVGLDTTLLTVLAGATARVAADGEDAAVDEALAYDSAVEERFARAWLAQEGRGRLGVGHGWILRREPRAIAVAGTVFIPDFTFSRGTVEVYAEIVGYYTEDYVARKRRKLAALVDRLRLLLVIEEELAPLFADVGFPIVTYKTGRAIRMTEVVRVLDTRFDPFTRRQAQARTVLAGLCAADGPAIDEAALCERVNCAGPSELAALWTDVTRRDDPGTGARALARRYVPGYGLLSQRRVDAATAAVHRLLDAAKGPLALDDVLACCRDAGIAAPDAGLLAHLNVVVMRHDLFGAARVYRRGDEPASEDPAPIGAAASGRSAPRRVRAGRDASSDEAETLAIGLFAPEPASP